MTINELAHAAAEGKMIPNAPIQAARSIRISAPLNDIWSLLIGVSDWKRWYPYLKRATLEGPFAQGSKLTYGGLV